MNYNSTYCLIMAGGVGSRFWPLSTENNPKQFLDILGSGKSLRREGVKTQSYLKQISRERSEGIEVLEVPSNKGVKIDD